MNRHQRRAQAKTGAKPPTVPPPDGAADRDPSEALANDSSGPPLKPGFVLGLFARLLLSRWVVERVQHPEAERLIMSMAREAGRTDVIDHIIRRQALRNAKA